MSLYDRTSKAAEFYDQRLGIVVIKGEKKGEYKLSQIKFLLLLHHSTAEPKCVTVVTPPSERVCLGIYLPVQFITTGL